VATINSTGLATAVAAGSTTILAVGGGITSNAATITVSVPSSGGGSGSSIASIAVIPGTQTVSSPGSTTQYLAIGTTGAGSTVNLTNQVAWSTSSAQIATIGAATGLASAVGQGTTTVAAIYSNGSGGTLVGTATMTVSGGTAEKYTGVSVTPNTATISASGQTSQLIALATTGVSGLLTDVTSSPQITWSSSQPSLATVSTTGLVTGRNAGTTQITAELTNPDSSVVTSTANVTVTLTSAPEPLISLTVIPNSITVGNLQDTGQFLAIGTYATAPYTRDLTNSPNLVWISDAANIFPISTNSGGNSGASAGIVTAYGNGGAVIIAEATNPGDGTIQTATATFNCPLVLPNPTGNPPTPGSCFTGSQAPSLLATLTVYNQGLNTSNWLVTASSATGTANVIHCGPGWSGDGNSGGSVCTATYPIGTVVTLTAPAQTGVNFGGWTSNCTGQGTVTAAGPNSCTVTLSTNDTVGGIFN
jgi:hypothetical protein